MSNQEPVICKCGDEYPSRSYGAGFVHGAGMCPNCDAALTDADRLSRTVESLGQKLTSINGIPVEDIFGNHSAEARRRGKYEN